MKLDEIMSTAKDSITVKRIYAEPFEKNGLTFIPAAVLGGGAGGGGGHDEKGQEGEGGGFGMSGRPAGAYVIKGGEVSWRPAIDLNRIVTMAGVVAVAYLISRPRMARARLRSKRR
ncbi:MAG: hypothetical protein ACXVWW_10485 [Nocardioides sp.]